MESKNDQPYRHKFNQVIHQAGLHLLPQRELSFIYKQALHFHFTLQELRQIGEIAMDLACWRDVSLRDAWPKRPPPGYQGKQARSWVLNSLRTTWESRRSSLKSYAGFETDVKPARGRLEVLFRAKHGLGFGRCPVASGNTRCCNLLTLDAVENCGFDCSYCSIQSFYRGDRVYFDPGFAHKLQTLQLDPDRVYHVGTGQSSDSLMWGNKNGTLDTLMEFARHHPNVILELKSKSKNISYLLKNSVPANVLCTWSLNTPAIIECEERRTAGLTARLDAARRVADQGILVGFHLHPIVHYSGWRDDYAELAGLLQDKFTPSEIAMVSLGTLTFTAKVIRKIRQRGMKSKILQMPMVESNGKLSYPNAIKLELFRHAYGHLPEWHDRVFFYLCMEEPALWKPVFGYDYHSNEQFELAMEASYLNKIRQRKMSMPMPMPMH
jgi:spore photoproduct lyase